MLQFKKENRGRMMNERIRELYIQTSNETADGKEWAIGGLNNAERFAELIVREVFDKIEDERFEIYQPVKESVMKHFGVEE